MSGSAKLDAKLDELLKQRCPEVMSALLVCQHTAEAGPKLKSLRRAEMHRILREQFQAEFQHLQQGDTGYQQLTYDGCLHPALERMWEIETGQQPETPLPLFDNAEILRLEAARTRRTSSEYMRVKRRLDRSYPEASVVDVYAKRSIECRLVLETERARVKRLVDSEEEHREATAARAVCEAASRRVVRDVSEVCNGVARVPDALLAQLPHLRFPSYIKRRVLGRSVARTGKLLFARRRHPCAHVVFSSARAPPLPRYLPIAPSPCPSTILPAHQAGLSHLRKLYFSGFMDGLLDVPFTCESRVNMLSSLLSTGPSGAFSRDDAEDCIDALRSHVNKTSQLQHLVVRAEGLQQASDDL